jgi:uncharacterized protein with NRDE domain
LVLAANRDEFYDRPTKPASFWEEKPDLLAGRDLKAGGTWLGITRKGRIAAITNYRQPQVEKEQAPSRGNLVSDFLKGDDDVDVYLAYLTKNGSKYNGHNLIFGYENQLCWYSNRGGHNHNLSPGLYGLSNHLLDTPWPKVVRVKEAMERLLSERVVIDPEEIFSILRDRRLADDTSLPDTGIGFERERVLSPIFIISPGYGTRSSTIISIDQEDNVIFAERTYNEDPDHATTVTYEFRIES